MRFAWDFTVHLQSENYRPSNSYDINVSFLTLILMSLCHEYTTLCRNGALSFLHTKGCGNAIPALEMRWFHYFTLKLFNKSIKKSSNIVEKNNEKSNLVWQSE